MAPNAPAIRVYRGSVAIVTGAASGIGAALARGLARSGARVVLADRQGSLAARESASVVEAGGEAEALELDVRDAAAVDGLVRDVHERHGRLDYVFNNAGIGVAGEMLEYRLEDWRDVIEVNLMGVVHGVQAAYRLMVKQGFGHIVNTASMAGLIPSPFMGSYAATKHAVVGLSRALRAEASNYGVRVSVLCPGVIRTPILAGGVYGRATKPVDRAKAVARWERRRPMDPDAFAREALRRVAANRATIVVPTWWRALWLVDRIAPGLVARAVASEFRTQKAAVDNEPR